MPGIRIRHRALRSCLITFPMLDTPMVGPSLYECPHCHVEHPFKTIHLWLDDSGAVIVSTGVYEAMRTRWSGPPEFDVVGEVPDPPALRLDGGSREEQDQAARAIILRR